MFFTVNIVIEIAFTIFFYLISRSSRHKNLFDMFFSSKIKYFVLCGLKHRAFRLSWNLYCKFRSTEMILKCLWILFVDNTICNQLRSINSENFDSKMGLNTDHVKLLQEIQHKMVTLLKKFFWGRIMDVKL